MQIPPGQNQAKIISRLKIILAIVCLLSGLLAGENVFRYALEVPGWRHIDIKSRGEYSRHADLKAGTFLFSLEAVMAGILLVIASAIVVKNKNEFRPAPLIIFIFGDFTGQLHRSCLFSLQYGPWEKCMD